MNRIMTLGLALLVGTAGAYSLYTDKKGRKAGDLITVLVVESSKASNDTRTETAKKASGEIGSDHGSGFLNWVPGLGLKGGAETAYDGKGETARNGTLKATVSARIREVLENGNLLVEGSKAVTINEEEEVLEVSGMLRPDDINPDNTVYSYKLADAVIRYSGKGVNSDAQKPGLITRFFNWVF